MGEVEICHTIGVQLFDPKMTRSVFLREMFTMFIGSRKLSAKQVQDLQLKKGSLNGIDNEIFHAAYVSRN